MEQDVCPECRDRGYTEKAGGLVMVKCNVCGVDVSSEIIEIDGEINTIDLSFGEINVELGTDSGTGQPDNSAGSEPAGPTRQSKQSKARKKARK